MEALTSDSYSDTSTASYASDHEQQKVLLSTLPKKPIKIIKPASNSAYLLPPTSLISVPLPSPSIAKLKSLTKGELRKGKWSKEEEEYTQVIINAFQIGLLPPVWSVVRGTTLRVFLAERLNCDAMRITKKFAGEEAIGKQVYRPRPYDIDSPTCLKLSKEIARLEKSFLVKLEQVLERRAQRKARTTKKRSISSSNGTFEHVSNYKKTKKQHSHKPSLVKTQSSTLDETSLFLSFIEGLQK